MSGPLVFESTESVIEVLWDVALAVFVIRLAFIYVTLTAVATAAFAWATGGLSRLPPHLPAALAAWLPSSSLLSAANIEHALTVHAVVVPAIVIPALCARLVNGYFQIPRVAGYRLAVGALSLVYVGVGALLAWLVVPARLQLAAHAEAVRVLGATRCHGPCATQVMTVAGGLFAASIALMPCLSIWLMERSSRTRAAQTARPAVSEKATAAQTAHDVSSPVQRRTLSK